MSYFEVSEVIASLFKSVDQSYWVLACQTGMSLPGLAKIFSKTFGDDP
jgi:hypothetical protein